MRAIGFANTSLLDVAETIEGLRESGKRIGRVLCASRPRMWRKPPAVLLTDRAALVRSVHKMDKRPRLVCVFDAWITMRGMGIEVVDAEPDSDPLARTRLWLSNEDIASAILNKKRGKVNELHQPPDLADTMFSDVDGSVTQMLLRLTANIESSTDRAEVKSTYVGWLLRGGGMPELLDMVDIDCVDIDALAEVAEWMKSEKGIEARKACRRLGRRLAKSDDVDYLGLVRDTQVAPFDLRYLATVPTA